jgi:hypothetical protein
MMNKMCYEEVRSDARELLYSEPIPVNEEGIPKRPLPILRSYHEREEKVYIMSEKGELVETNERIKAGDKIPYNWVAVKVEEKVKWFRKPTVFRTFPSQQT